MPALGTAAVTPTFRHNAGDNRRARHCEDEGFADCASGSSPR
jgi:hypothetical protein